MHIGVLTHNYPRFPGDFSGTFVEALCEELVAQDQQVTVWAPYDPAYSRPLEDDVTLRLYRYAWPERMHTPRLYAFHAIRPRTAVGNLLSKSIFLHQRHRYPHARGQANEARCAPRPLAAAQRLYRRCRQQTARHSAGRLRARFGRAGSGKKCAFPRHGTLHIRPGQPIDCQ